MARGSGERREPTFGPHDEDERPRHRRKKKSRRKRGSLFGALIYWSLMLGIWGAVGATGLIAYYAAQLPPIDQLAIPKRPPNIAVLADDGTLLANRGDTGGAAIHLSELPDYLPKAFIAIEDRRFYEHWGVDPFGIIRALLRDAVGRGSMEGGSTLTQQLAKNLFLTQERTLSRKIQEAILAVWLEHKYSKDQILELYLNRVYFGSGAFGVEAAAQKYFGHSARDVSLSEAAMLAGLMKAPTRLAPNHNLDAAIARATEVITAMAQEGYITEAMAKLALARPARPVREKGAGSINYVADYVMDQLNDTVGAIDEDIVVSTSISAPLQAAAEKALTEELDAKGGRFGVSQGALVALDPNGALRALVGGRSYADSQFNRAVAAKRQPGSAFKPFVYLTALERGLTPDSVRNDAPINVRGWQPEDYSHEYFGPVTLTKALSLSLNTVAVRLGLEVGPAAVAKTAHRLGITSDLQVNASIALGTSEVTPLELVTAYVPFANGGIGVDPYVITKVRTATGKLLYQRKGSSNARVIEPEYVAMMNTMMQETLLTGTARKAALPGWEAAGKTGTSQDWRDAWFVGYTSHLVAGVWLGNDDNSPTKRASGGTLPVEIWSRFMRVAHEGVAPAALPSGTWREPSPVASLFNFFGSTAPAPTTPSRSAAPTNPPPIALGQPRTAPTYAPARRDEGPIPPASIPNGGEATAGGDKPFFGLF
jgi:penicillin-binding protein 1A